jgi:hypothetical protein
MNFNNIYINQGDSREKIAEKINLNFGQIISFSSGPMGRPGPKGPTGYPGSAGPTGESGTGGVRGSVINFNTTQPATANNYDYWISRAVTGEGDFYRWDGSSWEDTSLSRYSDEYFSIKRSIPTFLSNASDFSAFYISGTDNTTSSVVLSDYNYGETGINVNLAKLLISSNDGTEYPLLSFRKSNVLYTEQPGFFWASTGDSAKLRLSNPQGDLYFLASSTLNSNIHVNSYGGNGVTGDINFSAGNNINIYNSTKVQTIRVSPSAGATGLVNLTAGRYLLVDSKNISITPSSFSPRSEIIFYQGGLNVSPSSVFLQPEGIVLERGGTSDINLMDLRYGTSSAVALNFLDFYSRPIFSVRQRTIPSDLLDYQTGTTGEQRIRSAAVFGSTGGANSFDWNKTNASSATGPVNYHVKSNNIVTPVYQSIASKGNVMLDSNFFVSDCLTVLPSNQWGSNKNVYAYIPGSLSNPPSVSNYPFWDFEYCREYRIMLDFGTDYDKNFLGVSWAQRGGTPEAQKAPYKFQKFAEPCKMFDLMYYYNPRDKQVYCYVKTVNGKCYTIKITDVSY